MPDQVTDFRIEVPEEDLDDLRDRLRRTRWPERETVADWSQGVPLAYVQELCRYWAEEYDWRASRGAAERVRAVPHDDSTGSASTSCTSARPSPTRSRWS